MAYSKKWNQPAGGGRASGGGKRAATGGVLSAAAICVLLLLLGGAWWWLYQRGPAPARPAPEKPKKSAKAVTPKPAAATPRPKAKDYAALDNISLRRLPESETNNLTDAQVKYWKMYHPNPPPDKNQPVLNKGKYRIFKSRTDNDIAFLMATEPGTPVFGSGEFFARGFERKFLKSLETPIVISDDDSEYDRLVKQAVIDARKELKERYDRGEDIEKIMRDTRDEIQRLGQYKIQVEKLVKKETAGAARKGYTDKDIGDIIKAANAMLEERGIAPVTPSPLVRRALKLQSEIGG